MVLPAAIVVTIAPTVVHVVLVTVLTVMPGGKVVTGGNCSTSSALRVAVMAASGPLKSITSPPTEAVELAVGIFPVADDAAEVLFLL